MNTQFGKDGWKPIDWSSDNTDEYLKVMVIASGKKYKIDLDTGIVKEINTNNNQIEIGSYVGYDVPYTDMYSGKEYTKNDGWRYLGEDDSGNKLIVSTGIPAILYYDALNNIENNWWATKTEISEIKDTLYQTTNGYDYNEDNGEPNKYVAYGLRYKFEKIPFTYQANGTSASTPNAGIFRKVGNTKSGKLSATAFEASGINVKNVHNLTLAELNKATNEASKDKSTDSGFKDLDGKALGLFDLNKVGNYSENPEYWLATPETDERSKIYFVYWNRNDIAELSYTYVGHAGVRVVVAVDSEESLSLSGNF